MKQTLQLDMGGVPETELVAHPQVWDGPRPESQDSVGKVPGTASRNSMLERATLEPAGPKGLLEDCLHWQDFHGAQACPGQKPAAGPTGGCLIILPSHRCQ